MQGIQRMKNHSMVISKPDEMTPGFKRGELIVIAARPGMGQVDVVCAIVNKVALETEGEKPSVLHFTTGNPLALEFRLRLDCLSARVAFPKAIEWRLTQSELRRLRNARKVSGSAVRIIPVGSQTRLPFIKTMLEDQSEIDQHKLIVLESLSLGGRYKVYKGITQVCKYLKELALSHKVTVIALCDLPSSVECRKNHVPRLDDLKKVGEIRKYADKILFVYRDSYYQSASGEK